MFVYNPFYARCDVVIIRVVIGSVYQRRVKNVRSENEQAHVYARMAKTIAPATKATKALLVLAAPVNSGGTYSVGAGLEGAGLEAGGAGGGAGLLLGATGVEAGGAG